MEGFESGVGDGVMRVGLVLGGGGAVGAAYHAGALTALQQDLGWDAREAEVIVGTSAGSLVGAMLRLGVPPTDLAALTVGAPALDASPGLAASLTDRPQFPPISLGMFLRPSRLPSAAMLWGLAKVSLRQRGPSFGAMSMVLRDGRHELAPHLAFVDTHAGAWPDGLRVCAVRHRDWHRTVFGAPDRGAPPLSAALAASCAVPGYFSPVDIDGEAYVDGGAISPTNADVLSREQIDLAVVVSPMTGKGRSPGLPQFVRRLCRQTLDRELRTLHRRGIPTVVIEPGQEVLQHMPFDFMSDTTSVEIVRHAFLDTGSQIRASDHLQLLRQHRATRSSS